LRLRGLGDARLVRRPLRGPIGGIFLAQALVGHAQPLCRRATLCTPSRRVALGARLFRRAGRQDRRALVGGLLALARDATPQLVQLADPRVALLQQGLVRSLLLARLGALRQDGLLPERGGRGRVAPRLERALAPRELVRRGRGGVRGG